MSQMFTEHARERAKERYGLDLSGNDMREIIRATKDGRAQLMKENAGGIDGIVGKIFVWTYKGRMILPVMDGTGSVIVTFQPADYFLKSTRREFKGLDGRNGHNPKMGRQVDGRQYRRPKSNRRRFSEAEE